MSELEVFQQHRPLLFSIAYRMLGSVMDAEDAVQETFLRWQGAARDDVQSPKSYLSTVVTRLCIDELRAARTQREQYVGPWLPEPLVTEEAGEMDDRLALADSLSMAFLVLLETLSPVERAVFLLREVFEYDYDEIAGMVGKSATNCRQMVHRARRRIAGRRHRFDVSQEQVQHLLDRFLQASASGDLDGLLELLAEDVTLWSDGGGKVAAALNPIHGADRVARFFLGLMRRRPPDLAFRLARVNGQPGVLSYVAGEPYNVTTFDLVDGKVQAIRVVVNPDKLRRVPPLTPPPSSPT